MTSSTTNHVHGWVDAPVVQAGRIENVHQHIHQAPAAEIPRRIFGAVPPRAGAFQKRDLATELIGEAVDEVDVLTGAGSRVLSGLGGVGKTQLAADYAHVLWSTGQIDVLMWVTAASRDAVISAYAQAADAVVLGSGHSDTDRAADRWLAWLAATDKQWLVVLDDVQDPVDLGGLWPMHTLTGRVVVTTRRRDASFGGDGRRVVEVGLFSPAEATAFLAQRLVGRPAQADGAAELAEILGYLPLALAQAAAYIANRPALTCATYLLRWTDRRNTLIAVLPRRGELPDEYGETLATTWSLSINLADSLDPIGLARPLLEMASLLDSNGIPHDVFTAPPTLAYLAQLTGREIDAEIVADALSCLQRLNLVIDGQEISYRAVRVHALVQRATREDFRHDRLVHCSLVAANSLAYTWPETDSDGGSSAILRANADALRCNTGSILWKYQTYEVFFRAGHSLGEEGNFRAATEYFHSLWSIANRLLGIEHPSTLSARSGFAHWLGESGDVQDAVVVSHQVLVDHERVLGVNHPSTLTSRHNLAYWRGMSGDTEGAVAALEQVVADCVRMSGAEHPSTLSAQHDLAYWRGMSGDAVGAAVAFERVLGERTRVLGPDDPHTLISQAGLARWRGEAGDVPGAVVAFERILIDCTRVLGVNHLHTLSARHNLAYWRGMSGDIEGAATAFVDVLADCVRLLGLDHPNTLSARHNLADWRGAAGDPSGAVSALESVLTDRERVLGINHLDTLITRRNLASWRNQSEKGYPPADL